MNKKAELIAKFVIWGVVILFAGSIVGIFFIGGDALIPKLAKAIPGIEQFIPGRGENDREIRLQSDEARKAFDELVIPFNHLAKDDSEACFAYVPYTPFETLFKNYDIELLKTNKGTAITLLRRVDSTNDETLALSDVYTVEVPGVSPCVVYGDAESKQFVTIWLNDAPALLQHPLALPPHFKNVDKMVLSKSRKMMFDNDQNIILDTDGHIKPETIESNWETEKNADYVLYKYGKNICLFPVKDGSLGDCSTDERHIKKGCFNNFEGYYKNFYDKPLVKTYSWNEETGKCGGVATQTAPTVTGDA